MSDTAPAEAAPRGRGLRRLVMISLPALMLIAAVYVVLTRGRYESTDNANMQQARLLIASDLAGRVTMSNVVDGARVSKGAVLFSTDPEPLRIALEQTDAAVAAARLQVQGLQAAYRSALSAGDLTRENLAYQETEAMRQQTLTNRGVGSDSALQSAQHELEQARQAVIAAEVGVQNALAALGGRPDAPVDAHPLVMQAMAARDRAAFTLSQAEVHAPADGTITQAGSFMPGQFVAAGTPVFSLMVAGDIWVEANFKETQLEAIAPGQLATVEFDTFPGQKFDAVVETISPGTGSEFSLLPAQNASGNWVKVTQRVTVKLRLDPDQDLSALRAGLSAEVTVDTQRKTALQKIEDRVGMNSGTAAAAPAQ